MSYGQGGPQSQWDPWKPHSQQPWNDGPDDGTPDWAALAEASETRNKRRKLLFIAGGVLATAAIGTAVAMAVVSANGGDPQAGPSSLPASGSLGSGSATPSFAPTSAPPPLDPKDFISSAKKDTAPLSADTLFPGKQLTMGDAVYKKGDTADTSKCASATGGTLPSILTANGCTRLIRVSYADAKGDIAVTVGVAVFDDAAQAAKVKAQAVGKKNLVRALSGKGIKPFCDAAVCRTTTNAYGRYAYFTTGGFTDGKDVTDKSTDAFAVGNDLAQFTVNQIHRRGQAQASAAANR
ncbi:hypothetical protein ACF073_03390 [Streptomyces sp. NPDC015171]|uniref:hypothetical protein n=1 Tax=Streptomyces sp. NPDC015171 TaxID=3364945 RepID=UPI0036F8D750